MLNNLWKITKSIPILRKWSAYIYYFFCGSRRNLSGINNSIFINLESKFTFLKKILFQVKGNGNKIIINSGARIHNTQFKIEGDNNQIEILENCVINSGCIWLKCDRGKIIIGKKTTIAQATIGIAESDLSVTIGNNCMFSYSIDIRCGDSHSIIDVKTGKRINYARDINIQDSVWLATEVKILKSLTIGQGSIIGAGSIVTKDIPQNCLAVGVPAEVKKTNVTWLREQIPAEDRQNPQIRKIAAY